MTAFSADISPEDRLIGMAAYELARPLFEHQLAEGDAFDGCMFVLCQFESPQILAFARLCEPAERFRIQIPAAQCEGFPFEERWRLHHSAVSARIENRLGTIVISTNYEKDATASLDKKETIKAGDLKGGTMAANAWVTAARAFLGSGRMDVAPMEPMISGLFRCGRFPIKAASRFLLEVAALVGSGETVAVASGKCLRYLGLPTFADCFRTFSEAHLRRPSHWHAAFDNHSKNANYAAKRGPDSFFLKADVLAARLFTIRSQPEQFPAFTREILEDFETYIGSPSTEGNALLFEHDWSIVRDCFERQKKTGSQQFVEKTRKALRAAGLPETTDEKDFLDALSSNPRRSGTADVEHRSFFETNERHIDQYDKRLASEWEDFVFGKTIECDDFLLGLTRCIRRFTRVRADHNTLVIEGVKQEPPNTLLDAPEDACLFFERHYANLPAHTNNLLVFERSCLPTYARDVIPIRPDRPSRRSSAAAATFEFRVRLVNTETGEDLATTPMRWTFRRKSICAAEADDIKALLSARNARALTPFTKVCGEYEPVGRKGLLLPVALADVSGFAAPRASSRGCFVPSPTRRAYLDQAFREAADAAVAGGLLTENGRTELFELFDEFAGTYRGALERLASDALDDSLIADMTRAYRQMLANIRGLPHEAGARRLLEPLSQIGVASIEGSERRPPLAVVCPWHPVRMESAAARRRQALSTIRFLLENGSAGFADGPRGGVFFGDLEDMFASTPLPEVDVLWRGAQAEPCEAIEACGDYSLHRPIKNAPARELDEDCAKEAAATLVGEIREYLRLQPHESNNLRVCLYNCPSPRHALAVVSALNTLNENEDYGPVTCEVVLAHRDGRQLQDLYRELVSSRGSVATGESDIDGFLAKVRINISAAPRKRGGRAKPIDIAYCRDVLAERSEPEWHWIDRITQHPADLAPHRWPRILPREGEEQRTRRCLCPPANTETGWSHLNAIANLLEPGAASAWENNKCPAPVKVLSFRNEEVAAIVHDTHDMANWVINEDSMLDRRLLQSLGITVIRYRQDAAGRQCLTVSSKERDALLVASLQSRIKALLGHEDGARTVRIASTILRDADRISGALALRAARRTTNTQELLGVALSKHLISSELKLGQPVAWCLLDDCREVLGKADGAGLADLLAIVPRPTPEGGLHVDIIVTEAKCVGADGIDKARETSERQLRDTLTSISCALDTSVRSADHLLWAGRIADLFMSRLTVPCMGIGMNEEEVRRRMRELTCTFRVTGFSHVFIHSDVSGAPLSVPLTRGIEGGKAEQECFSPSEVRDLLLHIDANTPEATTALRRDKGHVPWLASIPSSLQPERLQPPAPAPRLAPAPTLPSKNTTPNMPPEVISKPPEAASNDDTLGFLRSLATAGTSESVEDTVWLEQAVNQLRSALRERGLPVVLDPAHPPKLTPNAALIRLRGSREMTVPAVEDRAAEIYTTTGLKILRVSPGPGLVAISIERPQRRIIYAANTLLSLIESGSQPPSEEAIFIGVLEETGGALYVDPAVMPHSLVAGSTGSGKSVLLQNILLYIGLTRSPSQATIHLIDAKLGVDYLAFAKLPHLLAGSGGVINTPQASLDTLDELVEEMEARYSAMLAAGVNKASLYRRRTGEAMPTRWVFFDEFADWMQLDEYSSEVETRVARLGTKARAAGLYLIFSAQRPEASVMPTQLRSQLNNRIVGKVDSPATSDIALGIKKLFADRLLGRGQMLAITSQSPEGALIQVPYLDEDIASVFVEFVTRKWASE